MSINYSPSIIKNGMVLCFDAANVKSYAGSGTAWYDLSGNGYHGTISGTPGFNSANGGSVIFDGTSTVVTFNNPLNQSNLSQVWTVSAWVNITTKTTQQLINGLNNGCYACYSGNDSLLYLNSGPNDYYTYGGNLGNLGWVFATFRFDNSTGARTIYRNTTNISTSGPNNTSIPSGQNGTFSISAAAAYLQGNVGQVLMYNRYLNDDELTSNFNAIRSRYNL
jgi:hypothetical protein